MKIFRYDNGNSKIEKMINQVNQEIDQGMAMSQCLLKHPGFFSKELANILHDEQDREILAGILQRLLPVKCRFLKCGKV